MNWSLEEAADRWIKDIGRESAGRVADLVASYAYHRGVVAEVTVSGERWVEIASERLTLAPIQHLNLIAPLGDLAKTLAVPELPRMATIEVAALLTSARSRADDARNQRRGRRRSAILGWRRAKS